MLTCNQLYIPNTLVFTLYHKHLFFGHINVGLLWGQIQFVSLLIPSDVTKHWLMIKTAAIHSHGSHRHEMEKTAGKET